MARERFERGDASTEGATSAGTTTENTRHHEPVEHDRGATGREERFVTERERHHDRGGLDVGTMRAARARQREEFGGINWGAAFFGWLVAAGLGAILAGILSAAGASLALGSGGNEVNGSTADTIGIAGGIAFLVVLLISYFAGGYVAGRMSRFDGARQGIAAWVVGIVIAIALAALGAILGSEYNVLANLNLPRIPVDEGTLATGGIIALLVGLALTFLASMLGGKAGERYHKKIDRHAIDTH